MLEPFKDIDHDLIVFEGNEVLNNENVYKFLVFESENNPKSHFWIGQEDGIPRKIYEYAPNPTGVEFVHSLTNVKINQNLRNELFQFVNDKNYKTMDYVNFLKELYKRAKAGEEIPLLPIQH